MALTLDLSNEYSVFDNRETIAYYPQGATSPITITDVVRQATQKDFFPDNSLLHSEIIIFHVWTNRCPNDFQPSIGDFFYTTDDQTPSAIHDSRFQPLTYVVSKVDLETLDTRWKLVCWYAK